MIDTFLDFSLLPPDAPAFVLQKPPIIFRIIFLITVVSLGLLIPLSLLAVGQRWRPVAHRYSPFTRFTHAKMYNRFVLKLTVLLGFFNIAIGRPSTWLSLHNYSFLFTGPLNYKLMDLYFRAMRQHFIAFVSPIHPEITATIGTTPTCESQRILIAWNRLILLILDAYVTNALAFLPGVLAGVIIYNENLEEDQRGKAAKAAAAQADEGKKAEAKREEERLKKQAYCNAVANLLINYPPDKT